MFKKVKKMTPTELLKIRIQDLEVANRNLEERCSILRAENTLYKEFFTLHFKQGVPSLVKALRQATDSLKQMTVSVKGR